MPLSGRRSGAVAVAITFLVVTVTIAVTAIAYATYERGREAEAMNFELADRANELLRLDEVLANAALLAAYTEDPRWIDRYWQDLDDLNATLARTEDLAAATPNAPHIATTVAANHVLFDMETRALDLSARGEREEALRILGSPEYGAARKSYIASVSMTLSAIRGAASAEAEREQRLALIAIAASPTALAFLALSILGLYRAREKALVDSARHAAENERLAAARQARATALRALAHEMENPLTPVSVQIHLWESGRYGTLTDDQAKAIVRLKGSFEQLARLVEDIRDLGTVETGRLRIELAPVRIGTLVDGVVDRYRPQADAKGVSLSGSAADAEVLADPKRLEQVIENLVSNALKYAPSGTSVTVESRVEDEIARFAVTDQGPGLTREQIARLFVPFSQVQEPGVQKSGTGLGLYISRAIVEQHGGVLHVASAGHGQGATFAFELPTGRRSASTVPPA